MDKTTSTGFLASRYRKPTNDGLSFRRGSKLSTSTEKTVDTRRVVKGPFPTVYDSDFKSENSQYHAPYYIGALHFRPVPLSLLMNREHAVLVYCELVQNPCVTMHDSWRNYESQAFLKFNEDELIPRLVSTAEEDIYNFNRYGIITKRYTMTELRVDRVQKFLFGHESEHCIIDTAGMYECTMLGVAVETADIIHRLSKSLFPEYHRLTIADPCCGVGGNIAAFLEHIPNVLHVEAVDSDISRCILTLNNCSHVLRNQNNNMLFVTHEDCISWKPFHAQLDWIYTSAPWGGGGYDKVNEWVLPEGVYEIFKSFKGKARCISLFLPRSVSLLLLFDLCILYKCASIHIHQFVNIQCNYMACNVLVTFINCGGSYDPGPFSVPIMDFRYEDRYLRRDIYNERGLLGRERCRAFIDRSDPASDLLALEVGSMIHPCFGDSSIARHVSCEFDLAAEYPEHLKSSIEPFGDRPFDSTNSLNVTASFLDKMIGLNNIDMMLFIVYNVPMDMIMEWLVSAYNNWNTEKVESMEHFFISEWKSESVDTFCEYRQLNEHNVRASIRVSTGEDGEPKTLNPVPVIDSDKMMDF